MEIIRKNTKRKIDKKVCGLPEKGEGALVLTITEFNYVKIGDARIYLDRIETTGAGGGNPQVKIRIIADMNLRITRHDRVPGV